VIARVGSIRKAADELAITSTALNRRVLGIEDELGVPIFDRTPGGVRLSAAGEIFIHHVRNQLSDLQRVRSQIADLTGERRGHISIVCGQSLMNSFVPEMISMYRAEHPAVTFEVRVCNRNEVESELANFAADIAIVFEPQLVGDFYCVIEVPQAIHCLFGTEHPLADQQSVRLSEFAHYPMALPTRASGIRHLLEIAAGRQSVKLPMSIESDSQTLLIRSLREHNTITFQLPIGLNPSSNTVSHCQLDVRDVPAGRLMVGHLKGRNLPVASARFLEQMAGCLHERFAKDAQ